MIPENIRHDGISCLNGISRIYVMESGEFTTLILLLSPGLLLSICVMGLFALGG